VLAGPVEPKPGPILPRQAATAPIADDNSNPEIARIIDPRRKITMYKRTNAVILIIISGGTARSFCLTGKTAFG
jgi:hypothetical protein